MGFWEIQDDRFKTRLVLGYRPGSPEIETFFCELVIHATHECHDIRIPAKLRRCTASIMKHRPQYVQGGFKLEFEL